MSADVPHRAIFVCSCEQTMAPDRAAIAPHCGGGARFADQLCRRQIDLFKAALGEAGEITVGCAQEAPTFSDVAAEAGEVTVHLALRDSPPGVKDANFVPVRVPSQAG